jgi:hypothetical protein
MPSTLKAPIIKKLYTTKEGRRIQQISSVKVKIGPIAWEFQNEAETFQIRVGVTRVRARAHRVSVICGSQFPEYSRIFEE